MINIDDKIDWIRFYGERLSTQPKPAGDHKYNACCPFHKEHNPSFWFNTKNGCWKCETGCGSGNATSFLARLESIDTAEAYKKLLQIAGVSDEKERPKLPETLTSYSESKHLPIEYLQSLGMKDRDGDGKNPSYIAIPYYGPDGKCTAIKQRFNSRNKQRFGWDKGGKVTLYGLWLDLNKTAPAVILAEGESDAQSCWLKGLPCYGVPGATNFQKEWVQFIGERSVYIHVEPDNGGQQFRMKTLEKLRDGGFAGRVFSFSCHDIDEECKDPSDLLIKYGDDFRSKIDPALKVAHREDLNIVPGMTINEAKETKKEIRALEVYSASELYGKHLEAPPTIVRGAIPAGLSVLAGAPKRGKSWLALALAIAVASGQTWLGMPTERGDVLYLDLESKPFRVQKRLSQLLVGQAPQSLYISHDCEKLDSGLLWQIQDWAQKVEKPSLVIIDTLGRVDGEKKRNENAYQSDTRVLGELQGFALQNKLAILCVHHLKKATMGVTDPFEMISGSMGITGAADAVLLLAGKRGEVDSTLSITSRDFESKELIIAMDNGRWFLKSTNSAEYIEEQKYLKSALVRGIIAIAKENHMWQGTGADLKEALTIRGCAEASTMDTRKLTNEVRPFMDKLLNRDHVIFLPPARSGHGGNRIIKIMEAQENGF